MATETQRQMLKHDQNGSNWGTRVFLQPIAPPSVLGLFGFAAATFIVAAHMAGWYGNASTPQYLFPFAAFFGGLAQFLAGMWSYRARDVVATAMHGMWGSFWMAYGLLFLLFATGQLTEPKGAFPALGIWFFPLGAITAAGAVAALAESLGLFAVLSSLSAGSWLAWIALTWNFGTLETIAGWVFVFSAGFAFYTATAMMLEGAFGRTVLPLFKYERSANVPGGKPTRPIELQWAEPGVKQGQ
jgi:succinate-acetate transporter protein